MAFDPVEETDTVKLEQTQTAAEKLSENSGINFKGIKRTYVPPIKHTVRGKSIGAFGTNTGTYLQIGPHEYGGEVQDIQIIENKAVSTVLGVRTKSDFLVDDGDGDANIVVTMLFSGTDHIYEGLVPLIALFRVCPITSLRNEMISMSLLNKFTEDSAEGAQELVLEEVDKVLQQAVALSADEEFFDNVDPYDPSIRINNQFVTDAIFNDVKRRFPTLPMFNKWFNYQAFLAEKIVNKRTYDEAQQSQDSDKVKQEYRSNPKSVVYDTHDYVPVAFVSLDIQTSPEYSNTLVVRLIFKRIDVGAYGDQGLQYRTVNNTPEYDGRQAYWLRRAVDIYIDTYIPKYWIFGTSKTFDDKVKLSFAGSNLVLDLFKEKEKLNKLLLNSDVSAVTQMAITYSNKFSFIRMAGKSYPTAQFMGSTGGTASLAIRTASPEKYEAIHSYKSAADFFIRTADRSDRFNGWYIDSFITRLFSSTDKNLPATDGADLFNNAWYPLQVVSKTNEDSPSLKDISITFKETNPDFFSNFGFTVYKDGHNINVFRQFYIEMMSRAITSRQTADVIGQTSIDRYAHNLVFGKGDARDTIFSLLNPDTIVAAFFEPTRYNDSSSSFKTLDGHAGDLYKKLFIRYQTDSLFTGELNASTKLSALWEDIKDISSIFPDIQLNSQYAEDLAEQVAIRYFNSTETELINIINRIPEEDGRRDLYEYLFNHREIDFSDDFIEALFAAIVKRRKPFSDRQYYQHGLNDAYTSLSLSVEARAQDLLNLENNNVFNQGKKYETKVYLDATGLKSTRTFASNYPDFFELTYGELFNIDDGNTSVWEQFSPTYQDYGIINNDHEFFKDGYTQDAVRRAQDFPIASANSPIPPSVFFYHERKLKSSIVNNLDQQVGEWHDKLKTMRLNLPFDIETILTDDKRRFSGALTNAVQQEYEGKPQNIKTLATIIDNMIESSYTKAGHDRFENAAEDIVVSMADQFAQNNDLNSFSDILKDDGLKNSFKKDVLALIRGQKPTNTKYDWSHVSVPFLIGSHVGSPVAKWSNVTGLAGERMTRSILNRVMGEDIDQDLFLESTLTKSANGLNPVTVSCANVDENYISMLKITQRVSDNSESMMRAFPVMRLYLIDHIGPRILVQDNFYGYHAIESIDITLDKNDPGLAVIRLADPFHILQGSVFNTSFSDGTSLSSEFVFPASENDLAGDNILERVKLKPGRSIQIRGGYSADPENLEVLFSGRIAEVEFGDVVTIAAQDWKSELFGRQVEFELNSKDNSSVKDLVIETIRQASPAGMGREYSGAQTYLILDIANDLPAAQAIYHSLIKNFGTPGAPTSSDSRGTHGYNPLGFGIIRQYGRGLDLRLKNVWVPDQDRSRWNYFADISTTGWDGSTWTIPVQTAWETLQQATNYVWGYICQVVPYESEATLFFGRPDQMYFNKLPSTQKYRSNKKLRVAFKKQIQENFITILNDFKKSPQYDTGISIINRWPIFAVENNDYFNSTVTLISAATQTKQNITWCLKEHIAVFKKEYDLEEGIYGAIFRDTSKFRLSLYSKDFTEDLGFINSQFGGPDKAALLLMSHFYGMNYEFIKNNFNPTVDIAWWMKSHSKSEYDNIASRLKETLQSTSEFKDASKVFEAPPVSASESSTFFNLLTSPQGVALKKAKTKSTTKDTGFQLPHITHTITVLDISPAEQQVLSVIADLANRFQADDSSPVSISGNVLTYEPRLDRANRGLSGAIQGVISSREMRSLYSYVLNKLQDAIQINSQGSVINDVISRELPFNSSLFGNTLTSILSDNGLNTDSSYDLSNTIIGFMPLFKSFVHYFAEYLRQGVITGSLSENTQEAITDLKTSSAFDYLDAIDMKVFRDYHYINNKKDIIENNIAASTREMFNSVIIRYPAELATSNSTWYDDLPGIGADTEDFDSTTISSETEWSTWPRASSDGHIGMQFNDAVSLQEKKLSVYTDLNCQRTDQCAKVATNVLTKVMRPMYRNNLLILGRAIKPWDIVYLQDEYVDMYGAVEVERVVHHYSAERGWVTNVIPHALCDANPGNKFVQTAIFNNMIDRVYNLVDMALWATVIFSGIPIARAGLAAGSQSLKYGIQQALRIGAKEAAKATTKEELLAASKLGLGKGIRALGSYIGEGATKKSTIESLKALKGVLLTKSPAVLDRYFRNIGLLGSGANFISRLVIQNAGVGDKRLPVTFSPLMFKGVPLEAGLNGDEYGYFSMSSQLHWAHKDFMLGASDLFYAITHGAADNRDYQFIDSIHKGIIE